MRISKKGLMAVLGLMMVTCAVLAWIDPRGGKPAAASSAGTIGDGRVGLETVWVQDKVLKGDAGQVSLAVTLSAAQLFEKKHPPQTAVDMVIVLDRSGSMQGVKIDAARQAVQQLIERMAPDDRLALVTYSDEANIIAPLAAVDETRRHALTEAMRRVTAEGGTNLGGGLQNGIDVFLRSPGEGRQRVVILISDGLANQGITDPMALGQMAAAASDHQFTVSTVGVGLDFNEQLMTTIADQGVGRYYFLEDPLVFAQVFAKEFRDARQVTVAGLELRVPLVDGVRLVDAGGYPIRIDKGHAVIHPGRLISGQQRKIYLTFQVPTDREREITMGALQLKYRYDDRNFILNGMSDLKVACVADDREVMASLNKDAWSGQVVQEEYSRLKEEVAEAVRKGDADAARTRIEAYTVRNRAINAEVGSAAVAGHLENDVNLLRKGVSDAFAGPPAAVARKQKQTSKALQYESYQQRRDKK